MRDVEYQGSESTYVADEGLVEARIAFQRGSRGKSILAGAVASWLRHSAFALALN
jgi:hypothetical protein